MTVFTALPTVSIANLISEANLLIDFFGPTVAFDFEVIEKF